MFFSKSVVALASTLLLSQSVAGLGINCRGSGLCPLASFDNDSSEGIMQGLRDAMYTSTAPNTTMYNNGDHIICVSSSTKITINPSVGVSGDGASASVSVGLSGKIGNGGICVFAQNTASGMTLGEARTLIDGALNHGCTTCGSNPSTPGNNVDNGELTINYVGSPSCTGNCLSAGDGANPTAPTGKRGISFAS